MLRGFTFDTIVSFSLKLSLKLLYLLLVLMIVRSSVSLFWESTYVPFSLTTRLRLLVDGCSRALNLTTTPTSTSNSRLTCQLLLLLLLFSQLCESQSFFSPLMCVFFLSTQLNFINNNKYIVSIPNPDKRESMKWNSNSSHPHINTSLLLTTKLEQPHRVARCYSMLSVCLSLCLSIQLSIYLSA